MEISLEEYVRIKGIGGHPIPVFIPLDLPIKGIHS